MCGIVGFIGKEQAAPILLEGLSRLEYRGYDSAGLAVYDREKGLQVVKAKGPSPGPVRPDGRRRAGPWCYGRGAYPAGPPTARPTT